MLLKQLTLIKHYRFYRWKVRGDYNVVSKWFSGNQMPPYMAKSNEADLKESSHQ